MKIVTGLSLHFKSGEKVHYKPKEWDMISLNSPSDFHFHSRKAIRVLFIQVDS